MANDFKTGIAARNAALDAKCTLLDGGTVDIYSGSPPTNPGDASTGVLLVSPTFGSPAFASASSGTTTANAIGSATAVASGTAGYFRMRPSGGGDTSAVYQGTVGTSGCDLNLNSTTIVSGNTVAISAYNLTDPDIC